ncbi:MAG: ROK family protein [Planctomycetes bacterium]|nr:ROK family protein [Planctomycetota bacterium]
MSTTKSKSPKSTKTRSKKAPVGPPASILVVDIGGTKVKMLATGETEPRKVPSGKEMSPSKLVEAVKEVAHGWKYEAISIGYPGLVGSLGPRAEPGNLGPGWVGFNFGAAFGIPVRIINDAAMQALGSYEGGRMLFLGLGTGLGSALIIDNVIIPLELGNLLFKTGETIANVLGRKGFKKLGKDAWRAAVNEVITTLMRAFVVDYVVIGGGNAKNVKNLPPLSRLGHNLTAFRGGFRLWNLDDVQTLSGEGDHTAEVKSPAEWRIV